MMMAEFNPVQTVKLAGARNDSLLGYLKAIAVLRLTAQQVDRRIRGSWENGSLVLHGIDMDRLAEFFVDHYAPTPILNPWNSGAGFDAKSSVQGAGKVLRGIAGQSSLRWRPYIDALAVANAVVGEFGEVDGDDRKRQVLLRLRSRLADAALEWLDAAVLIGSEKLAFPTVLGTGGNDGRLDFAINYAARALDVVGAVPLAISQQALHDTLEGTSVAPLSYGILGQYRLGSGDYNNPWDLVLAMEGAIAFSGSMIRRYSSDSDRPTVPFQFVSIAVGYASASDEEETRAEIWLPQWRGRATYSAIRSMLRGGRIEIVTQQSGVSRESHVVAASTAADSIAAIQAAQTLGVSRGIASFGRIVIAQRNGLAFGATYVGRIAVADRPEIAALSRDVRTWVARVDRGELGARAREALRSYQEGIVAYAAVPSAAAFQDMLASLGDLDAAMALSRMKDLRPLPWLPETLHSVIDNMGDPAALGLEHRVARALTSLGRAERSRRLRYRISPVACDDRSRYDRYDVSSRHEWRSDLRDTLAFHFERSARAAANAPTDRTTGFAAQFGSSAGISLEDVGTALAGGLDWTRVKTLVRGYSIIEPYVPPKATAIVSKGGAVAVPVAFAALKTLVHGYQPEIDGRRDFDAHATFLDADTASQLVSRSAIFRKRAFARAYLRLRSAGADARNFSEVSVDAATARTFVAMLMVPVGTSARASLLRRSLLDSVPFDATVTHLQPSVQTFEEEIA